MANDSGAGNVGIGNSVDGNNANSGDDSGKAFTTRLFTVNPGDVAGTADTSNPGTSAPGKRGRGRPPGPGKSAKTAQDKAVVTKEPIRDLILLAHTVLVSMTGAAEFTIGEPEAEKIAEASVNVLRHYDIAAQSQKMVDWTALIAAVGMVYGPRVIRYRMRVARDAAPSNGVNPQGQPLTVVK